MVKKIKHRGMRITKEEHTRWHQKNRKITPKLHKKLMKKIGISEEADKEWHRKQDIPHLIPGKPEEKPVNPFAIGGSFFAYCVQQGWLKQEGKGRDTKYYFTPLGRIELKKLGISI